VSKLATSTISLYTQDKSSETHEFDKEDNEILSALYALRSVAQEENEKIMDSIADLERAMSLSEILHNGYVFIYMVIWASMSYDLNVRDRSAYQQRLTRLKTLQKRIANEDRSGEFTDYYRTIYRLHIIRNLPSSVALDALYRVDFRLTNEFGLFKYEEISQFVGSLPMHVTVLDSQTGQSIDSQHLEVHVTGEEKYVKLLN